METNTETQSGNVEANAEAQAPANEAPAEEKPAEAAEQSEGEQNDTSATPEDKDASQKEDGKVAEADKNEQAVSEIKMEDIKMPDGLSATDDGIKALGDDFKELGITSNEQAQKFVDWVARKAKESGDDDVKQQQTEWEAVEKRWAEEAKKDPVFGKDYEANVKSVEKLTSEVFSPRTKEYLDDTGLSKNPDFLKDMLRLANERADADLITGQKAAPESKVKRDSYGNPMLTFNNS